MNSQMLRAAILGSMFILAGLLCLQVLAGGIGLSGPAQDFSLQQGETMCSHLTVWNEGDEVENFKAWVTGEVTSFLSVLRSNFSLAQGESRVITLGYFVPTGQPTGTYDGYVSVSLSRQGILPRASRAVTIAVTSNSGGQTILRNGLNVSWLGPSGSFESVVPAGQDLFKIWERKSDGSYVSAQSAMRVRYGGVRTPLPDLKQERPTSLNRHRIVFFKFREARLHHPSTLILD